MTLEQIDEELARRSLYDFVPWVTPTFSEPRHLAPLVDAIHRIGAGETLRESFHAPPQHAKTETVMHGVAWLLKGRPDWPIGYVTYGADLSKEKSRKALEYARAGKVELRADVQAADHWETTAGGGLYATGVLGALTGRGLRVLVIDDPFRNRVEAESIVYRNRVWEWIQSVGETRMHPQGCIIVFMTRWHPDDPVGRMSRDWKAPHHRMPALSDEGEPLWAARYTLADLQGKKERVGAYNWESMYQGRPRPRGAKVFGDVHHYDALPTEFYRFAIGVDLAYTEKTSSDYSVAVVVRAIGDGDGLRVYVEDVKRRQLRSSGFKTVLRELHLSRPTAQIESYVHGTEQGAVDLMNSGDEPVPLRGIPASADKFIRAQGVAAAWNAGRVMLPRQAPWLEEFVEEVCGFTGVKDAHDDQVDALASAFDALSGSAGELTYELQDAPREGLAAYDV